jgi:Holliday junction resolvasome RuvABC DNA-binding subunit
MPRLSNKIRRVGKSLAGLTQVAMYRLTTIAVFVLLALAGCDRNQSQTPQQSTVKRTPGDHSQTKALRAASAVGYDGKQLQKQVDKVLEQKEKRDRDLENELNDTGP